MTDSKYRKYTATDRSRAIAAVRAVIGANPGATYKALSDIFTSQGIYHPNGWTTASTQQFVVRYVGVARKYKPRRVADLTRLTATTTAKPSDDILELAELVLASQITGTKKRALLSSLFRRAE